MFKKANSLLKKIFTFRGDPSKNTARPLQFLRVGKHSGGQNPSGKHRNYRMPGPAGTSGDKIKRRIARGTHGLVNKYGMIGRAIAEQQREN